MVQYRKTPSISRGFFVVYYGSEIQIVCYETTIAAHGSVWNHRTKIALAVVIYGRFFGGHASRTTPLVVDAHRPRLFQPVHCCCVS